MMSYEVKTVKTVTSSGPLPRAVPTTTLTVFPLYDPAAPGQGTLQPAVPFDPKLDAERLCNAMKGLMTTDKKMILNILCHRTNAQRLQIASNYKTMYGKDLIKDLDSALSGHFEQVICGLMFPPADFDAYELHHAMAGLGTDEHAIIEILASRTPAQIRCIKEAYNRLYGKHLEKAIDGDTSGKFKRLLISLCTAGRSEDYTIDRIRALKAAQDLYRAGVAKWGTDDCVFNAILCAENYAQLQVIFVEYQKLAKHDIEDAIKKEFSGDLQFGLLSLVQCIRNKPAYFAARLHHAMSGLGTKDRTLIRIIVSRCEVDMVQIKAEFLRMYGQPLEEYIDADTSGKYEDALLALISGKWKV